MKSARLSAVVVILMGFLCGCSVPTNTSPGPAVIEDPDQVTQLILQHLYQKYGQEFAASRHIEAPDWDIFTGWGTTWTLSAYPVWGTSDDSSFTVKWSSPTLENQDEMTDDYLLIRMRPLFRVPLDEGLASVLPEFLAEFTLGSWADLSDLPSSVSDKDFLQWAGLNVGISVNVALPAQEGFTEEELAARVAPLSNSGNTFGAKNVSVTFIVYQQDNYEKWVSSCEDLHQARTEPGILLNCSLENTSNMVPGYEQFDETIQWSAPQ